jgi:hypothetical protein
VVLVHGLHGSHHDWDRFASRVQDAIAHAPTNSGALPVVLYACRCNDGVVSTMKGTVFCATRAHAEVKSEMERLNLERRPVLQLSLVGESGEC